MDDDKQIDHPHHASVPVIRVAPMGELKLYVVSDEELRQLQEGSPAGLFLNFALTFLSVGVSLFSTLLATTIESNRVYITFVVNMCRLAIHRNCVAEFMVAQPRSGSEVD